jgi:hypothetical protein
MINAKNIVKRGMVLDAVTSAVLDFRSGNQRALITLEQFLADVIGIQQARKIMDIVRKNIDEEIPDIVDKVDKALSEVIPYE